MTQKATETSASDTPGAARSEAVLSMEGLAVERHHPAHGFRLDIPDLQVDRGDFVAILGESGCGKSTLLDVLGLILAPSEARRFRFNAPGGSDALDLFESWQRSDDAGLAGIRGRHFGYVLQTGGLLPFLNVRDNVNLTALHAHGVVDDEWVDGVLLRLGIADQGSKKPSALSGGQRQRAAIARALAHKPPIILADEPTAAVDSPTAKTIIREFQELSASANTAVVVVTHDHALVESIATKIYRFRVERAEEHFTRAECFRSK